MRCLVYVVYLLLVTDVSGIFIYLFNPQLDTMQVRTYNTQL